MAGAAGGSTAGVTGSWRRANCGCRRRFEGLRCLPGRFAQLFAGFRLRTESSFFRAGRILAAFAAWHGIRQLDHLCRTVGDGRFLAAQFRHLVALSRHRLVGLGAFDDVRSGRLLGFGNGTRLQLHLGRLGLRLLLRLRLDDRIGNADLDGLFGVAAGAPLRIMLPGHVVGRFHGCVLRWIRGGRKHLDPHAMEHIGFDRHDEQDDVDGHAQHDRQLHRAAEEPISGPGQPDQCCGNDQRDGNQPGPGIGIPRESSNRR